MMKMSIKQLRTLISEVLEEAIIDVKDVFDDRDVYVGKERRKPYVKGVFHFDAPEIQGHFLSDEDDVYSGDDRRASYAQDVLPIEDDDASE